MELRAYPIAASASALSELLPEKRGGLYPLQVAQSGWENAISAPPIAAAIRSVGALRWFDPVSV